jgi:hypothetical protein
MDEKNTNSKKNQLIRIIMLIRIKTRSNSIDRIQRKWLLIK